MSAEEMPDVDEIKARLRGEIPVEEETESMKQDGSEAAGSVDEALRNFGQQLARTIQNAWSSKQRQEIEQEIRQGVKHFSQEVEKVFQEAKDSSLGKKAQAEAAGVKTDFEQGDLGKKTRTSIVQGLQWLSDELNKVAEQFSPVPEEEPDESGKPES